MNRYPNIRTYFYIFFIYLLVVPLIFNCFKFTFAQDVIQYLSISHKYISGDIKNAINGVWGPLISWLLIPFLLFKIPDLYAFKILQIFIGIFLLLGVNIFLVNLFATHEKKNEPVLLINCCLIIVLIYYIFFTGTPDLLLSTLIFYYCYFVLSRKYLINKRYGLISGLGGAFAYYAKAYALPFFFMHFTLINLFYFFNYPDRRKYIVHNYLTGMVIFLIICSAWIIILSNKYGYFTYSTAGNYNFSIMGPQYQGIHTFRINKIYPPVNQTATSYWEDPSFLPVKSWNIFSSWNNIKYFLTIVINNTKIMTFFLIAFSPFFLLLLFLVLYEKLLTDNIVIILLATALLYSAGYLPLFLEERFFIFPQILIIIMTFFLSYKIINRYNFSRIYKRLFYFIILTSILFKPLYSLFNNIDSDKQFNILSSELKYLNISGNYAGMSSNPLTNDWGATLFLAYDSGSKFYGEINSKLSSDSLYYILKRNNINYLFVWDHSKIIFYSKIHKVLEKDLSIQNGNRITSNIFAKKIYSFFGMKPNIKGNTMLTLYKID